MEAGKFVGVGKEPPGAARDYNLDRGHRLSEGSAVCYIVYACHQGVARTALIRGACGRNHLPNLL